MQVVDNIKVYRLSNSVKSFLEVLPNPISVKIDKDLKDDDKKLTFKVEDIYQVREEDYLICFGEEWVVKEINKNGQLFDITAVPNIEKLEHTPFAVFKTEALALQNTLDYLFSFLSVTEYGVLGWTYSLGASLIADPTTLTRSRNIELQRVMAIDVIKSIVDTWFLEVQYDTLNKNVIFHKQRGQDTGVYFSSQLNLRKIEVKSDTYDFVTRLIPIGKDDINISSVNAGSVVLDNNQYSEKVLAKYWVDNRYTSPLHLKEDATIKLSEMSKPLKTYSCDVIDLSNVRPMLSYGLGDYVTILDEQLGIRDVQRIVQMVEYPYNPENNTAELANRRATFDELQNELIDTRQLVSQTFYENGTISQELVSGLTTELQNLTTYSRVILLTNESQSLLVDPSGAVTVDRTLYTGISVFQGGQKKEATISNVRMYQSNGVQITTIPAFVITNPNTLVDGSVSLTLPSGTNLPSDDGYITIPITVTEGSESTVYVKRLTWTKVFSGADGTAQSLYTWVRYATDSSGANLSPDPTGRAYIGFAYNKTSPTPSSNPADYTWSLYQGADGVNGADGSDGADGVTYYTWVKYADTPTTGMSDSPTGKTYIGLAFNKLTPTESTTYGDYAWSLIKGTDGINGTDGISAFLTNDSHTVPTDANGNFGIYTGAVTQFFILQGATDITNLYTVTRNSSGVTFTGTNPITVTDMSLDVGYVDFVATRSGYPTLTKRFALSKNKQGATGTTGADGADGLNGADGANGLNQATLYLYQRKSGTAPLLSDIQTLTYTFASASLTGTTGLWSKTIPAGTDPLYITTAVAVSSTATDSIANSDWATPVLFVENGADGTDGADGADGQSGLNTAVVFIYKRSALTPTNPTGTSTYNFATGSVDGLDGGWSNVLPATNGFPLWVTQATASAVATSSTDDILSTEWASPIKLVEDGTDGINGEDGNDGQNATSYWLIVSPLALPAFFSGVYKTSTIALTGMSQTGTGSPINYSGIFKIYYYDSNAWVLSYTSASPEATKSYTAPAGKTLFKVEMWNAGNTLILDEVQVPVIFDGTNGSNGSDGADGSDGAPAITALLSNEAHTVYADKDGVVGSFAGATSTMYVYVGASDDSATWTYSTVATNCTITGANTRTVVITAMSSEVAYVDITASKSGFSSLVKRFTISKSIAGQTGATGNTGASATSYWLVSSTPVIQKSPLGVYTPAQVLANGVYQTGTGTPTIYSTRFIVAESVDGSLFTDVYTSASNELGIARTPSAGIKAVRVRMYLAGGTTTLLDEQIIPVVSDGSDGSDGADGANGTDGENGRYVYIISNGQMFLSHDEGATFSPDAIYLSPVLFNVTFDKWEYTVDGLNYFDAIPTKPDWAGSVVYAEDDEVLHEGNFYRCVVAHTSTASFENDLLAGYWLAIYFAEVVEYAGLQNTLKVRSNTELFTTTDEEYPVISVSFRVKTTDGVQTIYDAMSIARSYDNNALIISTTSSNATKIEDLEKFQTTIEETYFDGNGNPVLTNLTDWQQTVDDFLLTVQSGGGYNLIRNSVGYRDVNTTAWTLSGAGSVASVGIGDSFIASSASKNGISFNGTKTISQVIATLPNRKISLSARAFKNNATGRLRVLATIGTTVFTLFDSNTAEVTGILNGSFQTNLPESVNTSVTITVEATSVVTSGSSRCLLTDIVLAYGENITEWQQANGEMHNINVLIDADGMTIKSIVNGNEVGYTNITPYEFAGYYQGVKIFTLNGDTTEVKRLKTTDGIILDPIRVLQTASSVDFVWSGA